MVLLFGMVLVRPGLGERVELAILVFAVLAGAFVFSDAVIGFAARRISGMAAAGGILMAAGLFLMGADLLPSVRARGSILAIASAALLIAGLALQARAMTARTTR